MFREGKKLNQAPILLLTLAVIGLVLAILWLGIYWGQSRYASSLLDTTNKVFAPCPNRDNCRNSDDAREKFYIAPIIDADGSVWKAIPDVLDQMPRVQVITITDEYMHFTQASAFFRFIDDIEFHRYSDPSIIAIRSASRLGYRDFGVNQDRIEEVRTRLHH